MENNNLNEGKLALKQALLMMNYDSKKTLNENLEKINIDEQAKGIQALFGAGERALSSAAATEIKNVLGSIGKPIQAIDGAVLSNGDDVIKALKLGNIADDGIRSIRTALLKTTTNAKIRTKLIDTLLENPQVTAKYAGKTENQIRAAFKKLGYTDEAATEVATKLINKGTSTAGATAGAAAGAAGSKIASLYQNIKGLKWKGLPRLVRWGLTGSALYMAYRYFIREEQLFPECLEKKIPDNLLADALKNKSIVIKSTGNKQIDTLGGLKFYLDSDKVSSVDGSYKGTYDCDGDNLMAKIGGREFIVAGSVDAVGTPSATTDTSSNTPSSGITPVSNQDTILSLDFAYNYPGDNKYTYAYNPKDKHWYTKNKTSGKVYDITVNYPSTEKKLDSQFPQARNPNQNDNPAVQAESLKNSLKKNLKEIKTNKENLMVESNIISKRLNFITEGKTFETEEDRDYLVESLISEISYLKVQGYSSKAINEGIFSFLGNMFSGSVTSLPQVFGEYISGWLLKKLGVPEDSYIGSVVVSLVSSTNISEYDKLFTNCRYFSNKLGDALIEGYLLQMQKTNNLGSGASGFLVSAIRNSVMEWMDKDKSGLVNALEDKIADYLCPSFSKITNSMSDKAQELKDKVLTK